ncbi:MAG: RnfABCDGE type electron transport complex subunit D [Candidatus Aminicenantia bacterium]
MNQKEEKIFIIQSSPHLKDKESVPRIMYTVIFGLIPAVFASIYFFRLRAVQLIIICVVSCLITEGLFLRIRNKSGSSLWNGSAIITGILLALTLPPSLSLELAVIGSVVAIGIGKQAFGGLGYNIFNPALVGRAFLQTAFPVALTTWTPTFLQKIDTSTFATPLGNLKFQDAIAQGTLTPLKDLFWGNVGGCIGETSAFALLIGGIILFSRRCIDWRIPIGILSTLFIFTGIFWVIDPNKYTSPVFHILAGGILIGAIFMATDMVTSPITPRGAWIYAIGIGFFVGLIRLFGGFPEGVMFSILFMNAFVPLINRYTRSHFLGEKKKL